LNFQILGDLKFLATTDSIGRMQAKIIDDKSIWLKGGDLDGYKSILNGCLENYQSIELDSIARLEYKKYKGD
jgi:hypothetical protein